MEQEAITGEAIGGQVPTQRDGESSGPPPRQDLTVAMAEQHRLTIETWIRGVALLLVVLAVVVYPLYAMVFGISGANLSEVIAPVTGIAGAIVGYWFGQASRRISSGRG